VDPIKHKKAFQNALLRWFSSEGKDYPWRRTQNPWEILVSEVMLQQTLVKTVLNFYEPFLARFPSPLELAQASEAEILSAWEGLGYYRRVRNLQKAAKAICQHHSGVLPREHDTILSLPGIGAYTAGAISSFAYNDSQAIVDANVARVFARLFNYQERIDTTTGNKQLWSWARALVHPTAAREYNSALMELGQTYCSLKAPNCQNCPVQQFCSTPAPEQLPKKKPKRSTILLDQFCIFAYRRDGERPQILLMQEASGQRREGMWKLPERKYEELQALPLLYQSNYAITHHKVTLYIYLVESESKPGPLLHSHNTNEAWFHLDELSSIPMPSPFRKAINHLLLDYI